MGMIELFFNAECFLDYDDIEVVIHSIESIDIIDAALILNYDFEEFLFI